MTRRPCPPPPALPRAPVPWGLLAFLYLAAAIAATAMFSRPAAGQATQPSLKYVGCYSQKAGDLAAWRARGVNFAMHWEGESGKVTQRQWRAAARAAGLLYADTYLEDADADDPYLIGWILKDSDEWNRARGSPATRPAVAPFVAQAKQLAALNAARGTAKFILANADGPSVTVAMWERPPYNGVANNERALIPSLTAESLDWYPVMLTASNTPAEVARRPLYLPAQGLWRLKTWDEAWGHQGVVLRCAIVEAAKRWNAPLGATGPQIREQVDYLTGSRPFPVPDASAKPVQYQGQLIDMLVWWTANGHDGPAWKWYDCDADQEAALLDVTSKLLARPPPPPVDPAVAAIQSQVAQLSADNAALRADLAAAKADVADRFNRLGAALSPATQPSK